MMEITDTMRERAANQAADSRARNFDTLMGKFPEGSVERSYIEHWMKGEQRLKKEFVSISGRDDINNFTLSRIRLSEDLSYRSEVFSKEFYKSVSDAKKGLFQERIDYDMIGISIAGLDTKAEVGSDAVDLRTFVFIGSNFSNCKMGGILFQPGTISRYSCFTDCDFRTEENVYFANMEGFHAEYTSFEGSKFGKTFFNLSTFLNCSFKDCDMSYKPEWGYGMKGGTWTGSDFSGANLENQQIRTESFNAVTIDKKTNLKGVEFEGDLSKLPKTVLHQWQEQNKEYLSVISLC